jgi:hypothetical protein
MHPTLPRRSAFALVALIAIAGFATALGLARTQPDLQPASVILPIGDEVTIVFKRDITGVGPIMPRHGRRQDPASTNLIGFLVAVDDAWACVRVERLVQGATKPFFDDVWMARDTILLMVRN